jgi:hypothetical protein
VFHEQLGEGRQHLIRVEPPGDTDGQALTTEFVDHREHFQGSSLHRPIGDKVVSPDMMRIFRPQTDTGPISEPQPSSFGLSCRDFQPLPPPDALHPLGVNPPAFDPQQGGDAAITIAAICASQPDDRRTQGRFIIPDQVRFALGRTRLTDSPASPPFRDRQSLLQMDDTLASAFGA